MRGSGRDHLDRAVAATTEVGPQPHRTQYRAVTGWTKFIIMVICCRWPATNSSARIISAYTNPRPRLIQPTVSAQAGACRALTFCQKSGVEIDWSKSRAGVPAAP